MAWVEDLTNIVDYWRLLHAGQADQVPMWAQNVLRSFAWTEQRLEAMLHSVLTDDSSDSPDITHIEEPQEPSVCLQEEGEEGEEEVQDFSDDSFFEEDPVERVLDRHLENWFQQRDTTPSPVREQNGFYGHDVEADVGESPSLALDSASPSDLAPASSTGRQFKWGSCPQCGTALHVAVPLTGRFKGQYVKRCNGFRRFTQERRRCWYTVLYDGNVEDVPRFMRHRRRQLVGSLDFHFRT